VKQNAILLLVLLLFASARCSPGVPLPATSSPTTVPQPTTIPVTETPRPTVELPKEPPQQALYFPELTPSVSLPIDEETVELTDSLLKPLTITIVYDNVPFDERLKPAWGFAALVEYQDHTLLFDTGGDGSTLVDNMRMLGIDPGRIDTVVLSHVHADHTSGLNDLLEYGARPVVYVPPSFSTSFKRLVSEKTEVVEVAPGQMIAGGIFTTGEMGESIAEQALVIKTDPGLVIITGCAHPGIVKMVEQACSLFNEPVHLVLGGFHLTEKNQDELNAILRDFRRLEVNQVAPSHCTGEQAVAMFAAEYGDQFVRAGIGKRFQFNSAGQ